MFSDLLRRLIRNTGLHIASFRRRDIDEADWKTINTVWPYTMTSVERLVGLIDAVRYVVRARIPGSIVECGVWRGGSAMAAALTLMKENDATRDIYLYDTFQGMTQPTDRDRSLDGAAATDQLRATKPGTGVWCRAFLEEVEANLKITGYPSQLFRFVKGDILETIPTTIPEKISILRLDTDWYESTRHELRYLYPLVSRHGVVIVDDYGHWQGCRAAVDDFFSAAGIRPYLQRLDYTGRVFIKDESCIENT